jgi:hypothetical protein
MAASCPDQRHIIFSIKLLATGRPGFDSDVEVGIFSLQPVPFGFEVVNFLSKGYRGLFSVLISLSFSLFFLTAFLLLLFPPFLSDGGWSMNVTIHLSTSSKVSNMWSCTSIIPTRLHLVVFTSGSDVSFRLMLVLKYLCSSKELEPRPQFFPRSYDRQPVWNPLLPRQSC